jgi:dienelactone hydrolase
LAICGLSIAIFAGGARATEEHLSIGGLSVVVWSEPGPAGRRPILIFSHGAHGCATQSRFLMEAFAHDGYMVFAPNHRDATCVEDATRAVAPPEPSIRQPELWNADSYRSRADDIRNLIAALRADPKWRGRIDWRRLGLVGHSLGGYTALELAGAWPEQKMPGIRAVLGLSPYVQPFVIQHTMGGVSAPVMFEGGTEDVGITPTVSRAGGGYDFAPPPKYFVEFADVGHMGWTDVGMQNSSQIVAYSLAFLDHYIKGSRPSPILTHKSDGVAELWFQSELGKEPPAGR